MCDIWKKFMCILYISCEQKFGCYRGGGLKYKSSSFQFRVYFYFKTNYKNGQCSLPNIMNSVPAIPEKDQNKLTYVACNMS